MKLKSYCRGIGCGIIVAALVMMSVPHESILEAPEKNETLLQSSIDKDINEATSDVSADEPIIKIESLENSDTSKEALSKEVVKENTEEIEKEVIKEVTKEISIGKEENESSEEMSSETPTEAEITPPLIDPHVGDDTGFEIKEESVEIKVISGDSSVSVSRHLFEAGLVESAVEFDKYLCENGYDKFICVGTYEIEPGADFETIAKILTKR